MTAKYCQFIYPSEEYGNIIFCNKVCQNIYVTQMVRNPISTLYLQSDLVLIYRIYSKCVKDRVKHKLAFGIPFCVKPVGRQEVLLNRR